MKNLPHILLIEEEFTLRKTTRFLLERLGFRVTDVANKTEAHQLVDLSQNDLNNDYLVVLNDNQTIFSEMELLGLNYKLSAALVNN